MADENELKITADTAQAQEELKKLGEAGELAAGGIEEISKASDEAVGSQEAVSQAFREYGEELGFVGVALDDFVEGLERASAGTDLTQLSASDLKLILDEVKGSYGKTTEEIKKFVEQANLQANGTDKVNESIRQLNTRKRQLIVTITSLQSEQEKLEKNNQKGTKAFQDNAKAIDSAEKEVRELETQLAKLNKATGDFQRQQTIANRKAGEFGDEIRTTQQVVQTYLPNIFKLGLQTALVGQAITQMGSAAQEAFKQFGIYSGNAKDVADGIEQMGAALRKLDFVGFSKNLGGVLGSTLTSIHERLDEGIGLFEKYGSVGERWATQFKFMKAVLEDFGIVSAKSNVVLSEMADRTEALRIKTAAIIKEANEFTAAEKKKAETLDIEAAALVRVAEEQKKHGEVTKSLRDEIEKNVRAHEAAGIAVPEELEKERKALGILTKEEEAAGKEAERSGKQRETAAEKAAAKVKAEADKEIAALKARTAALTGDDEARRKSTEQLLKAIEAVEQQGDVTKESGEKIKKAVQDEMETYAQFGDKVPENLQAVIDKYGVLSKEQEKAIEKSKERLADLQEQSKDLADQMDAISKKLNETKGPTEIRGEIADLKQELKGIESQPLINVEDLAKADQLRKKINDLTVAENRQATAEEDINTQLFEYYKLRDQKNQIDRDAFIVQDDLNRKAQDVADSYGEVADAAEGAAVEVRDLGDGKFEIVQLSERVEESKKAFEEFGEAGAYAGEQIEGIGDSAEGIEGSFDGATEGAEQLGETAAKASEKTADAAGKAQEELEKVGDKATDATEKLVQASAAIDAHMAGAVKSGERLKVVLAACAAEAAKLGGAL